MKQKLRIAIAGLGARGLDVYAQCLEEFSDRAVITAVADVDSRRVERAARRYQIPPECCFASAAELIGHEKLADALLLCTPDREHYRDALAALEKGYHLLLEKPVARTAQECIHIAQQANARGLHVMVCHLLRYTVFYQSIKALLEAGRIGRIMSVEAIERVAYWHQAHSFVRGNWHSSAQSTPMILQKCCHDMDILLWLTGKKCQQVSSFGALSHFHRDHMPAGAPERCSDDCPAASSCPYHAQRFYLGLLEKGDRGWPVNVLCSDPTPEKVLRALEESDYGRCVYQCSNDVVDHQSVQLLLEGDICVAFTMSAFTATGGRCIRLMGTQGEITADMERNIIRLHPFGQEAEEIDVNSLSEDFSGHGGGDKRMVADFLALLEGRGEGLTAIEQSVESHLVALAAEESRLRRGETIDMVRFISEHTTS